MSTRRLAIVATHPIQYYAPWFAHLSRSLEATVEVFYLWDFGVAQRHDPGFGHSLCWDIDLRKGYAHRFVKNRAISPGTHHFGGLDNPSLVEELVAWKPDAILMYGYRFRSHLRVMLTPQLRRVPFLFRGDSHLLAEANKKTSWSKRVALRVIFRRFAAFLSVGTANAAYFRRFGAREEQIFRSPHAVDLARFARGAHHQRAVLWKQELRIPPHHRVVLFAGKFERKKRPDDLIRAFLAADLTDTTLLMVGAGALEKELLRLAQNHPCIRFAPFQNQSHMPRVYAVADLVVLPSCGAGETWGFALQEACAVGCAVLASDHVGCHLDLIHPGQNGLVFPAGDEKALCSCLRESLADPDRLKTWGAASRRIVSSFTYDGATGGLRAALNFTLQGSA